MKAAVVVLLLAAACGGGPERAAPRTPAAKGAAVAERRACTSCHSIDGSRKAGPTWKGLYGKRVELADGTTVVADDAYLTESIRAPDARTVDGFGKGVMAAVIRPGSIPDSEIAALVAYIKTLR